MIIQNGEIKAFKDVLIHIFLTGTTKVNKLAIKVLWSFITDTLNNLSAYSPECQNSM